MPTVFRKNTKTFTSKGKATKISVLKLAFELGYEVENLKGNIKIINGDKLILKRSWQQAYNFLYGKKRRLLLKEV